LNPPAVVLVHDARLSVDRLEATVVENWQRVDRTANAMRGYILWDAWMAGLMPGTIADLIEQEKPYVSRLISYGAVIAQMVEVDEPWDTLPTERSCREYISDAREYVATCMGVPINRVCENRDAMRRIASNAIKDMTEKATASTLPDSGELFHEPEKHPRQIAEEAFAVGEQGRKAMARFNKRLDSTLETFGTLTSWAEKAGGEERDMVISYAKSIIRKLSAVVDELGITDT